MEDDYSNKYYNPHSPKQAKLIERGEDVTFYGGIVNYDIHGRGIARLNLKRAAKCPHFKSAMEVLIPKLRGLNGTKK